MRNPIVLCCTHCLNEAKDVLVVAYTSNDKSYQFLCGDADHGIDDGSAVHFSVLSNRDASLLEFLEIEGDFMAERASISQPWSVTKYSGSDWAE